MEYGEFPQNNTDHINGIRKDNRLSNLRNATYTQNKWNSKAKRIGLKGASFNGWSWCGQIQVGRKNKHLGSFKTEQEAHNAYCKAAGEHFGEFARHR
jgi:hypothetical protein